MTQFVALKFNPWDRRTYTYRNDGDPVSAGDSVEVVTAEGRKIVVVDGVTDKVPPFECKAIVGKVSGDQSAP